MRARNAGSAVTMTSTPVTDESVKPRRTVRLHILALALCASASAAADDRFYEGQLRIGGAGILCVKEPCPRIGISAEPEPGGVRLGRPMFAGPTPPPMRGAAGDLEAVRAAWAVDGCVVIDGRFSRPPLLEVRRVVRSCARAD